MNGCSLPVSEGAIAAQGPGNGYFIVRLSAHGGRFDLLGHRVGGNAIVVDAGSNAYVVAGSYDAGAIPVTTMPESGHMLYIGHDSSAKFRNDVVEFRNAALPADLK